VISLRRTVDFRRALEQGERFSDGVLALRALKRQGDETRDGVRLGISVGRRFGKAVQRNRLRRQLRESARISIARAQGAWDVVLIPQAAARAITYDQLRTSTERLLRRAGIHAAEE
jgi:ribonuclease P protein component